MAKNSSAPPSSFEVHVMGQVFNFQSLLQRVHHLHYISSAPFFGHNSFVYRSNPPFSQTKIIYFVSFDFCTEVIGRFDENTRLEKKKFIVVPAFTSYAS
jgi:hypothetical protein